MDFFVTRVWLRYSLGLEELRPLAEELLLVRLLSPNNFVSSFVFSVSVGKKVDGRFEEVELPSGMLEEVQRILVIEKTLVASMEGLD